MIRQVCAAALLIILSVNTNAQFSVVVSAPHCYGQCNGTAAVQSTIADSAYHFAWSTADSTTQISGLCAGTYTCTVSNPNHVAVDTLTAIVDQPQKITDTLTAHSVSCTNAEDGSITIVALGGTPPYTYQVHTILTLDTTYAIDSNGVCNNLPSGGYLIYLADSQGCIGIDTTTVANSNTPCTRIKELILFSASLLPNPANDLIMLSYELNTAQSLRIAIYDLSGREIKAVLNETEGTGKHNHRINLKALPAGNYLLKISGETGASATEFIKQ